MASGPSTWTIGTHLKLKLSSGESVEGDVFCYDAAVDCLVIHIF
jgi:hypothetical protein